MVLVQDFKQRGETIAQVLSNITLEALSSQDYERMERYISEIIGADFVKGITILGDDGMVLAGKHLSPDSHLLLTEHPIRSGDILHGMVRIAFSTTWIDSITWKIVYSAGVVLAIVHIIGLALINLVLNNTIYRPLTVLQKAIHKIAEGNHNKKIDTTRK